MATTTRPPTKTITMPSASEEPIPEPVTQRKRADGGRFRLRVDRQTKASYATYEAAEKAGLGIKKEHPTRSPFEHRRVGADFHCSPPRYQVASSLSSSVPGVSRSAKNNKRRCPPTELCSKHRSEHKMSYSQWSAGFRLTRTSARTVTNSIVNKATSADAAWISPVHQT
jgi:hypothetical protein